MQEANNKDNSDLKDNMKKSSDVKLENIESNSSIKIQKKLWKDLKYIPNKKRFILLSILLSFIEFGGFFIFGYAFRASFPDGGIVELGLFLLPPFFGAALSYLVESRKEAVGISFINATSSIIPFILIYSLLEVFVLTDDEILLNLLLLPICIIAIIFQIIVAFTLAKIRIIYGLYEKSGEMYDKEAELLVRKLKEDRKKRKIKVEDLASKTNNDIQEKNNITEK